jgi:hypothetical protein
VTIMHTSRVTLLVSLLRGRQSLPLRINLIDCIGCDANRHAGVRFVGLVELYDITRTDSEGRNASRDANSQAGVRFTAVQGWRAVTRSSYEGGETGRLFSADYMRFSSACPNWSGL